MSEKTIAIIDYGAGNLRSVEKALMSLGAACKVTAGPEELLRADAAVLPGVGAFGDAMNELRARGLEESIRRFAASDKPFLGICLGLQILFDSSEESPGAKGLGLLPGKILRIPAGEGLKVPHMGWNSLTFPRESRLFAGLGEEPYVYFVHSYYLQAGLPETITACTQYGVGIHAAVERGNLFACQFHPEKSGTAGKRILRNFLDVL